MTNMLILHDFFVVGSQPHPSEYDFEKHRFAVSMDAVAWHGNQVFFGGRGALTFVTDWPVAGWTNEKVGEAQLGAGFSTFTPEVRIYLPCQEATARTLSTSLKRMNRVDLIVEITGRLREFEPWGSIGSRETLPVVSPVAWRLCNSGTGFALEDGNCAQWWLPD